MKRSGLGKGINVLFGELDQEIEEERRELEDQVRMAPIGSIDPNRDQPRKRFDPEKLDQLAASIRSVGIIQPIVVAENGKRYTIIAGERRWRAARLAELEQVPVIVRDAERIARMEMSLIENIQRDDLNAIEEAVAIERVMKECAITQEAVAQRLGKSRPAVANLLRLLALPEEIRQMVERGELSEGHARALASLEEEQTQLRIAHTIVSRGLNVRQAEQLVKAAKAGPPPETKAADGCAELNLVEEAARRAFGVKVSIAGNEQKGRLILSYANAQDLERIYQLLSQLGG